MVYDPAREERNRKIIDALNTARSMELHAIHQYMIQHYDLDNMDYGDMAMKVKLIAIDEMRHAEMLADRIEESADGRPASWRQRLKKGRRWKWSSPSIGRSRMKR